MIFDTVYAQSTRPEATTPIGTRTAWPLVSPSQPIAPPKFLSAQNKAECQNMYGTYMTNIGDPTAQSCLCRNPKGWEDLDCLELQKNADLMKPYCATFSPVWQIRSVSKKICECPAWLTVDGKECIRNDAGNLWLECSPSQMVNGGCHLNIYKTLGIRQSDAEPLSPTAFVQDLILSATSIVWVVITIVLVYTGFQAVMGWFTGEDSLANVKKALTGIVKGLLLIMLSYTIVRAIQFMARWY